MKDLYEAIEIYKASGRTDDDIAILRKVDAQVLGKLQKQELTLSNFKLGHMKRVNEEAEEGRISLDLQKFLDGKMNERFHREMQIPLEA